MIQPIVKDILFLSRKSEEANENDQQIIQDLIDTLQAHRLHCVGLAANMIGKAKQILVFFEDNEIHVMLNPKIIKKKKKIMKEEGCLSLSGVRKVERYEEIIVQYQDRQMKQHVKKYSGYSAQIIQHEMDHFLGILI